MKVSFLVDLNTVYIFWLSTNSWPLVLEKLKRDYGVKVVATRDRPGANLVINCDDYTHVGSSICAQQTQASDSLDGQLQSRLQHEVAMAMNDYASGEQNSNDHNRRGSGLSRRAPYGYSRESYTMQIGGHRRGYESDGTFLEGYTTDPSESAKNHASDEGLTQTTPADTIAPTTTRTMEEDSSYGSRTTPAYEHAEVKTQVSGLSQVTVPIEHSTTTEQVDDHQNPDHEQQGVGESSIADQKHHHTNLQYYTHQDS